MISKTKPTIASNLKLAGEWDSERNVELDPKTVTLGSGKKVWWICKVGHSWQARVDHRANGVGCPACSGRIATPQSNLQSLFPDVAREWDEEKNETRKPDSYRPKSNAKVWWKCPVGHSYEARISERTRGTGCPVCSGNVVSSENCLAITDPGVAAEWHPTRNGKRRPENVSKGSGKKVWWLCPKGHSYEASPNKRTGTGNNPTNCPYCANQRVGQDNSLAAKFPEIAAEWDYDKNGDLTPKLIVYGSQKKVFWKCARGHVWKTTPSSRTRDDTGCPKCRPNRSKIEIRIFTEMNALIGGAQAQTKVGKYELDVFFPALNLAIEVDGYPWHSKKGQFDLEKSQFCENKGILLIRVRDDRLDGIAGTTVPYNDKQARNALPICKAVAKTILELIDLPSNMRARVETYIKGRRFAAQDTFQRTIAELPSPEASRSLATMHPAIAKEWDVARNHPLTPFDVTPGSGEKVWWVCSAGHGWNAAIYSRAGKRPVGCPICSNRKVTPTSSLNYTFPEIAREWHPTNNHNLSPEDVVPGSGKKVWWQCRYGHDWQMPIERRTKLGRGCPVCRKLKGKKSEVIP